ncbi:hypothetical protein IV508_18820 [Citrobacter werkmanii]
MSASKSVSLNLPAINGSQNMTTWEPIILKRSKIKDLDDENRHLKQKFADLSLDNQRLKTLSKHSFKTSL